MARLAFDSHWAELIAAGRLILAGGGRGLPLDDDDSSAGRALAMSGERDHARASGEISSF
jgi:hypothetical protein